MICPKCRKQLPDNAEACSYCGTRIDHKTQVGHEIKFRRYQRWAMYAGFVVVALILIGVIAGIYTRNARLIEDITKTQTELDEARKSIAAKDSELRIISADLTEKDQELRAKLAEIQTKNIELDEKTQEYKKVLEEKVELGEDYDECQLNLDATAANIYNLIIKLGVGVSNEDLNKIMLADANFVGPDSDGDGLPDAIEVAIGTDPFNPDTDGDGFDDKTEVLGGYNPLGPGRLPIDQDFAAKQKGKILLQVEGEGGAWYINSSDLKKYYLGKPADAFRILRDLDHWNTKQ